VRALELYRGLPLGVRLHTGLRAWSCPMEAVVARLPRRGRLLDVGCGHGLLSNQAALERPELSVLGIDPSPQKVRWAQATLGARPNVRFRRALLDEVEERGFDAVAVVDVLYLVPRAGWPAFLEACRVRLRRGGRLLLKEVDRRPRWKFQRCVLQESVSVRLLGITLGSSFSFAARQEMEAELARAGFSELQALDLGRGYLTPHVLYEGVAA
jgi:2-polyprenyl-6-hydroxyphenyl methylase/3-demethylubiquinone-9 3-methyltransferase